MRNLILFLHLAAAIFWMGGMAFMVLALRPALHEQQPPPVRLRRFFVVVMVSIAVLLASGVWLLLQAAGQPPVSWHVMAGLGLLMMLVFGHIFFSPWRRLQRAVAQQDWPQGGQRMNQIALLVKINLGLGWLAIAAVLIWR